MEKEINLYLENQSENAKLIYVIGILWTQISTKLDLLLSKYSLNISKFNILMIIKHVGQYDGIQQNEISKRLLVTASNITKLLDKLEKDGLITRNSKKDDKRVKLIRVTDKAAKLLDIIWPLYINEVKQITDKISKNNIKTVEKILLEWLTNIN